MIHTYKIVWLKNTTNKQTEKWYKNCKLTGDDGEVLEFEIWDFIKSTKQALKKSVKWWLEQQVEEIPVFSVYEEDLIMTEEDL